MELPALYVFKSGNLVMHSGLVSDAMKAYNDAKSKILETKDKEEEEERDKEEEDE